MRPLVLLVGSSIDSYLHAHYPSVYSTKSEVGSHTKYITSTAYVTKPYTKTVYVTKTETYTKPFTSTGYVTKVNTTQIKPLFPPNFLADRDRLQDRVQDQILPRHFLGHQDGELCQDHDEPCHQAHNVRPSLRCRRSNHLTHNRSVGAETKTKLKTDTDTKVYTKTKEEATTITKVVPYTTSKVITSTKCSTKGGYGY